MLAGIGGVGSDTSAEAAEFVGVAAVPDVFGGRMLTELAVLQDLAGGGVKDREGPVGDEVSSVLAAYS